MKEIHLGGKYGSVIGNYALVDDDDFEWLNQWKWTAKLGTRTKYAIRSSGNKEVFMHRQILGLIDRAIFCDHIDGNGLNNQQQNIRQCTRYENNRNRSSAIGHSSIYKGVSWYPRYSKWLASIRHNNKLINLGYFAVENEAAMAYNEASVKYHGAFGKLNRIEP